PRVHVDQHGALVDQRVAVEKAARPADLPPADLDVVARPVARIDPQAREAVRDGLADLAREVSEGGDPERRAVEDERPAELALVEVDRAAARDAAHEPDAVRAAIVHAHLARERLMAADERRGREAHEADGIGHRAGFPRLDERLVERDLPPS